MSEEIKIGDLVKVQSSTHKDTLGYVSEVKSPHKQSCYCMVKLFDADHPVPIYSKRLKVISSV